VLIGNTVPQQFLKDYLTKSFQTDKKESIFLLINGPKYIGKTTIITQLIQQFLGNFFQSDFLYIKDCSDNLNKKHILKISVPNDKKKQFIELEKDKIYEDIGTREITKRLQKAPMGKAKVVFVENIERMNISAANAFLKTCEEPLPNRLIIASTSNKPSLLDTILSRAISINFHEIEHDELLKFCQQKNIFNHNTRLQKFACRMAMGKPGLLLKFQKLFKKNKGLEQNFLALTDALQNQNKLFQSFQLLKSIKEAGILSAFLDGRINYCTNQWLINQSHQRLSIKKMLNSNINQEHLILYWLLQQQ